VSILLIRNRYAASLRSGGWFERQFMVVSLVVGLRSIPMSRWDGFLVIVRSKVDTMVVFMS
jgi:hypothetical protein